MRNHLANVLFPIVLASSPVACGQATTPPPDASTVGSVSPTTPATPSGAVVPPSSSVRSSARPATTEDMVKQVLDIPASEHRERARAAYATLLEPAFKLPAEQIKVAASIAGEGVTPSQKSGLLRDELFLKGTTTTELVQKLCGEPAKALADAVQKAKPEEGSAVVSKQCHLEAMVPAADLPSVDPWFLLLGAVYADELKQAGSPDDVVQLGRLVPYAIDAADVRKGAATKK